MNIIIIKKIIVIIIFGIKSNCLNDKFKIVYLITIIILIIIEIMGCLDLIIIIIIILIHYMELLGISKKIL